MQVQLVLVCERKGHTIGTTHKPSTCLQHKLHYMTCQCRAGSGTPLQTCTQTSRPAT
jgi:hypothetical protein